jgi:catechol 2,3-dioxygenase
MSDTAAAETLPFALTTPIHVASAALKARNVDAVAAYYRDVLGLETLSSGEKGQVLGAGGVSLLAIEPMGASALPDDPRSAGLFHIAFLMPTRADLGRWIVHASRTRIPVEGMSDHIVSEAFYLSDPEGNGVEIYADRPLEGWEWEGGEVRMSTDPLDVDAIVRAAMPDEGGWAGAPAALRIGHVHLRVGAPQAAERWWNEEAGLATTCHYPGAVFLSSGGYHHHIGANAWQSRGAGARDPARSGLAHVTLSGSAIAADRELVDPWGNVVRFARGT